MFDRHSTVRTPGRFHHRKGTMRNTLLTLAVSAITLIPGLALASDGAAASSAGDIAIAIGIVLGLGVLGGSLGQARAAAAALEGIGRNPDAAGKLFTPLIVGLALIESLVIYALVISYLLVGKIPG